MPRRDSLLAVNLQRGVIALARADVAGGRDPDKPPTAREMFRATFKATAAASRVTALTVMWAKALADLDRDELRTEEYATWAGEGRSTVYRHLAEFRELWPEYDTPNELAALLRKSEPEPTPATLLPA